MIVLLDSERRAREQPKRRSLVEGQGDKGSAAGMGRVAARGWCGEHETWAAWGRDDPWLHHVLDEGDALSIV